MKYIVYTIYSILLVSVALGVFAVFPLARAVPNLGMLALVALVVITDDLGTLLFIALVSGVLWDVITGFPAGTFILGYVLVAAVLYTLQQYVLLATDRMKYLPLLLLIGHVLLDVWILGFTWFTGQILDIPGPIVHPADLAVVSMARLVYHALLLYPIYMTAVAVDNLLAMWNRRSHIR